MKNDIIYWIWYQNIHGVSTGTKVKLLSHVDSPKEIFKTGGKCLTDANISPKLADRIAAYATPEMIESFLPIIEKNPDMGMVSYFDFDYPQLLCQIKDPPLVLYYKGDISLLKSRCLAIVGTRSATERGKYHAKSFARELASEGYTVIGGLSEGIEAAAHIGALTTGATCAVMHSGLDKIYPRSNRELFEKICKHGVVISEHMPGQGVGKYGIPLRNRLISGLSEGVILIEAPERSGALTVINYAVEQNRDVWVLDDGARAPESSGNRALISEGAASVTNPYDIINNNGFTAYDSVSSSLAAAETALKNRSEHHKAPQPVSEPVQIQEDHGTAAPKEYSGLTADEEAVLAIIRRGINQFDDIAESCELDVGTLGYVLMSLEFNGIITQKIGKVYEEI